MRATRLIRPAAVAGLFYSDEPHELRSLVNQYLQRPVISPRPPKGLIVPHAGFPYSGPVAGTAYAQLKPFAQQYQRVVVIGPSHHVAFHGLATSSADKFATPLGHVSLDRHTCDTLNQLRQIQELDVAHAQEHSLEVQLPFLQIVLPQCELVPLVVGQASTGDVVEALDLMRGGPETLIVASSDLSHYHDYVTARQLDAETVRLLEERRFEELSGERACGFMAVRGLLAAARGRGLNVTAVDVRNSGDTAGPRDQVVGYAACVVSEEPLRPEGKAKAATRVPVTAHS